MPGTKTFHLLSIDDDADAERTYRVMQVPGGVVLHSETLKINPGGGVSESMVFITRAQTIEVQPDDWQIFGQPLSAPLPLGV